MLGVEGRLPAARPPLAVLHLRLGPELRRHLRAPRPGCPTRRRSTSASPRRATRPWLPTGARTSSSSCRCPADVAIGRGGDDGQGSEAVERAADAAIDQVASWAGVPDLRERIRVRHTVGPEDFARRYNAWRGGALGLEHTLRQSAFFRPANVSVQGRRAAVRRGKYRPGRGAADVPDQRRAGPQAADGRPVGAAGARMTRTSGPSARSR